MKIIDRIEKIEKPFKNAVITIGNFDGVHIGHQALFHTTVEKADAINGTSVAITFEPHPLRVLTTAEQPPLITLYEQKCELIERTGVEVLICIPFSLEFAAMSAMDFVEKLLVEKIGMKAIVVGNDYSFGRNREGNLDMLNRLSGDLDFSIHTVDWIQSANGITDRISSTRIRELVMEGHVHEAKKMLGRDYQIRGRVSKGRNRGGRLLGFATANINLQDELCPKRGIYAVTVEHNQRIFPAVANIGYSPTFDDNLFTVEVHILDFSENIYDKTIRVNFIRRLRDEIKFDSIQSLSDQIRKDILQARDILSGLF